MSDFRRPPRAGVAWDVVIFWLIAAPLSVYIAGYVLYLAVVGLYGLALANAETLHRIGIAMRVIWRF